MISYLDNLTLENSYICIDKAENSYLTNYMAFSRLSNFHMYNNYITNTSTSEGATKGEGMMVYYYRGALDIIGNEFRWFTTNWLMKIGNSSTAFTNVKFNENIIAGTAAGCTCTIGIMNPDAITVIEIYGNEFYNVDPSTISIGGSTSTSVTLDMQYNFFDDQRQFKFYAVTGCTKLTSNNNCYMGTNSSSNMYFGKGSEVHEYTSLNDVKAGYADYVIGLIGVVENTTASLAKIQHARSVYDKLNATQKALVSTLSTLEAAEAAYAAFGN